MSNSGGRKLIMLMVAESQHTSGEIGARLRRERQSQRISVRELARRIGSDPNTVSRLETGKRRMSVEWLSTLSDALGLRASELLETARPEEHVVVRAAACANSWLEDCWYGADKRYAVQVPADPRYPGVERFALDVLCPSMNLRYPEGSLLMCAPLHAVEDGVEIGKRYLIETRRTRDGVEESELTVKTLIMDSDNRLCFVSESSDPDFQLSVPVFGASESKIQPIALVIGSVRSE